MLHHGKYISSIVFVFCALRPEYRSAFNTLEALEKIVLNPEKLDSSF